MKIWHTGKPAIIPTLRTTVQAIPVEGMRDSLPNPDGVWGSAPCRIFTGMYIEIKTAKAKHNVFLRELGLPELP
jgi:hypothetical protein